MIQQIDNLIVSIVISAYNEEKYLPGLIEDLKKQTYNKGNIEILFLEDKFAVVCYHAKLSSYPVTLPIGFMTTNIRQVNHIISLAKNYLSSPLFPNKNEDEIGQKDFGLLKP